MKLIRLLVLMSCFFTWTTLHADELDKADSAVANTLFEYDGSEEFATYKANEDGSVDLIFASNTPDDLYEEIITKLQNHPDISGVLASQGGPACRLF